MEQLHFQLPGNRVPQGFGTILVGVVGSGNLEVMVEHAADTAHCSFAIHTSARGFAPIWEAVVHNFQLRHRLGGVSISINDMGATPAVVSLRLDQAAAALPLPAGVAPEVPGAAA